MIVLLLVCPLHVHAFDFHGIKSGMSKDQVAKSLEALGARAPNDKNSVGLLPKGLNSVEFSPSQIKFSFDHEDRLYSLVLVYTEAFGIELDGVPGRAFILAIERKYKATLERERDTVFATLVDEKRYERYVAHLVGEAIGRI